MFQNNTNPLLVIDLKIRYRKKIYKPNLTIIVKWIIPVVAIIARILIHFIRP